MNKEKNFEGFIRFLGPAADAGSVDIGKAGKSLVALDRIFKKYLKSIDKEKTKYGEILLKISSVKHKCAEIDLILDQLKNFSTSIPANLLLYGIAAKKISDAIGFSELGKNFFGTVGEQLALKIFSKGKKIKENTRLIKNGIIFVSLENINGDKKEIKFDEWERFKTLSSDLGEVIQLEKGKEEDLIFGYKESRGEKEVIKINYKDKPYFEQNDDLFLEERAREDFDYENAKEVKIVGKFIDFRGLAHKYRFTFQSRKNQEDTGKQKILCIVPDSEISKIIDFLKPENSKNVCISGLATKDWEEKIDKIKIDWVNEDENYNPKQTKLI